MKKMLIPLAIAFGAIASTVHGQGTIQFLNSGLSPITYCENAGSPIVPAPIGVVVGVFWGTAVDTLRLQTPTTTISTTPGVFNGGAVYALTGTQPGQTVFLKIAGWYNLGGVTPLEIQGQHSPGFTHYGETAVVQTTALGPTAGPGTVVWQGAAGTSPNRVKPFMLCIPEPSVWALSIVGLGALLLRRRREA